MQKYTSYFLVLTLCFAFIACEEAIDLELPAYENDIVLYGVLVAGEKPQILLTESTGYFEPLNNRDRLVVIEDAEVKLSDGEQVYNLSYDSLMTAHNYWLTYGEFLIGEFLGGYTNDIIIDEGKTYTIEVKQKERIITGKTTVPKKVNLNNATHEIEVFEDPFSADLTCWRDKIEVNFDDPADENFYELNVITELWEYDCYDFEYSDTAKLDSCYRGEEQIDNIPIFDDEAFNGNSYSHEINTYYESCSNVIPDTSSKSSSYSIHKYTLQSISKEFYDFNTSLIMQQQSEGNPFQEPSTIKSTIKGGIGVFAGKSAVSDTIKLKVYD